METKAPINRGRQNEDIVEQALETIKNKGLLPVAINKVTHSMPNSAEDRRGYDLTVVLETGLVIPVQVKSCDRAKRQFERKLVRLNTWLPVVVVYGYESLGELVHRVVSLLKTALSRFDREEDVGLPLRRKETRQRCNRRQRRTFRMLARSMCYR